MAVGFESPLAGQRAVVAGKGLIRDEGGYRGGRGILGRDPAERFSETGAVALAVGRGAEFPVSQEPEGSDIFATIQAGQTELSIPKSKPP